MKFSRAGYLPALVVLLQVLISPTSAKESTPVAIDYWQTSLCPQSCALAGPDPAQWTYNHDTAALNRCGETTLFEMTLSNPVADPNTQLLYRACATGDSTSGSTPQRRQHLSHDPNQPRTAQATLKLAKWGTTTSSSDISSISSAVTQLADFYQQQSPSFTSLFSRSGNVVAGLYIGEEIAASNVPAIAHKFLQSVGSSSAEREAVQICGSPNFTTGPRTFGLVYDTTGDLAAVQSTLSSWYNASCVTGSQSNTDLGTMEIHLVRGNQISVGPQGDQRDVAARSLLVERTTCSYTQVKSGDTCTTLAAECNVTLAQFETYNGGASQCNTLQPGQYVCCSSGTPPDFSPKPYANGTCYTYGVQSGDTCSAIASAHQMSATVIENNNNNTWGWMGCSDLLIGMSICLSTGNPPYPANVPNAVCGPQVNNTVFPANYTQWPGLNPCPLKACCDIWGQCGITSDFCTQSTSSTGAPGTAAPGSNGCISNCGTAIVASSPPASFAQMGYFESFNDQRPCLHMEPKDIPSTYTDVLFAFGNITDTYDVDMSGAADMFQKFLTTTGFNRIMSFGGWTFSTDPSTAPIFRQGVAPMNRSLFAGNVASFIQSYNLQGVNFDWEYPGPSVIPGIPPGSPEDGANYLEFLNEVRNLLPSQYSISITAPASYYYLQNFPIYDMSQVVDYIVYMTYDLHGQWDYGNQWTDPGCPAGNCLRSQTNQTETQQAFSMITKAGVPANMIMVGQPLYGRSFQMTNASCYTEMCTYTGPSSGAFPGSCTGTAGYISNWEINQIISNSQWSASAAEYYSEVAGDIVVYDSTQWISWMKPSTYNSRSEWAQSLNFGGVCDWAMDLNASYAPDGTQIGEGSGVVYVPPDIYSSASPTVTCLPPCTFVMPPWTLTTNTTIIPPATSMTLEEIWPSVSTSTNGVTSTYYISSTVVSTITIPPITTDTISVWNIEWTDTAETVIYLTSSIIPPPFTRTEPPDTMSTTTLPGTTYTFAPEAFPPVITSIKPPPPPPGYTVSAITITSGPPSPQCTTHCGGLCHDGCAINPPCIGVCGCIGGGCPGGGGCIGPRCNALQSEGRKTSSTTCATSSTVTDCSVACSVTDYGDSTFSTSCYTTACSTVVACQTAGSTTTSETTTAMCPLSTASSSTWTPVSGAPLPYLGTDNLWTTPGPSTTVSDGSGSGNGTATTTTTTTRTTTTTSTTTTTNVGPPPAPTRKALIMLSELITSDGMMSSTDWSWDVIEGDTTSTTYVCNAKSDMQVPADTISGKLMTFPDRNIGPFTSHGVAGCMYYGTTNGKTVGTMTCPGVGSVNCEKDPQWNSMFTCGPFPGSYLYANVKCIF